MIETYMFFQIRHLFPVFERIDFTFWVKQDVGVFLNLLSRRIKQNLKSFQSLSVCFLYYSRPWVFPANWGVFGGLREAVVRPRLCGWRGGTPSCVWVAGGTPSSVCGWRGETPSSVCGWGETPSSVCGWRGETPSCVCGWRGKHPRLCVGCGKNTLVTGCWLREKHPRHWVWVAGETPSCGWELYPRLVDTSSL